MIFPRGNNTTCISCENDTNSTEVYGSKVCYPWVAKEFINKSYSINDVNDVVRQRNIAGIAFLGVVIVFGLIGNSHVLFVFCKRKYKSNGIQNSIHANYRIFVLWLSILSVIDCAIVAPLLIIYLLYPVTYPSNVLCKLFRFSLYLIPVAMSLTLVAIAIDRYLVICKTFANKLTPKYAKLMCVAITVFSLVLSVPASLVFGNGKTDTGIPGLTGMRCYLEDVSLLKLQQYYQVLLVLFFFVVLIVLLILYSKVRSDYKKMLRFRRTSRRYSASTSESLKRSRARQEKQRLWIYASVTVGYVGSALPYHILAILFFAKIIVDCDLTLEEAQVFYLFIWSYFFSPVINPIIYGLQDDGFRFSVQNMYKQSRNSISRYLFDTSTANSDSNGEVQGNQITNVIDVKSDTMYHFSTRIKCESNGEPRSELNDILTSVAAKALNVNEIVLLEDSANYPTIQKETKQLPKFSTKIKYESDVEPKAELNEILTSVAAMTLNVNEVVLLEDVKKTKKGD